MLRPIQVGAVRGILHLPEHPNAEGLVLTHGAGSNSATPLLVAIANAFADLGITVLRCELAFRQKRPHGPPPRGSAEEDQESLRHAVEYLRTQVPGRIYLGGHSYGGRQCSMLAASHPEIAAALLLLAYPLHPPKQPTQLRTAHFPNLRTPALFVHGSRDGMGTHEELETAIKLIPAKAEILETKSAGHELLTKHNATDLPPLIATKFREFI